MGELFRRFWMPACLSEEIPSADCPPVRVKLLGESLIAFRDSNGTRGVGRLVLPASGARRCSLARNEECGIRCVYHGWKFDVSGACVDMPNTPEGESYKDKVTLAAYPCFDAAGMGVGVPGAEGERAASAGLRLDDPAAGPDLRAEVPPSLQLLPGAGGRLRPEPRRVPPLDARPDNALRYPGRGADARIAVERQELPEDEVHIL